MDRNAFARQDAYTERIARQAAATASDRNRGAGAADRAGAVTSLDPDSGEVVAYGLTGITTLGDGFRVRG